MADSDSSDEAKTPRSFAAYRAIPLRHPVRGMVETVMIAGAIFIAWKVGTNDAMNWHVVGQYFFDGGVLEGLAVTLELTILAMLVAILMGLLVAVMRMADSAIFSTASGLYIWAFRGTPTLLQLIGWYNLASIFPSVSISLPFIGPVLGIDTNSLMTPLLAATLGLGLNESAYMAEIIRAGIQSVEPGQIEAASALGMTPLRTLRRIVLPQAMRVILPPTGNEVIGMLKYTSLASVVSLRELLGSARGIYSQNFQVIPLLIVASLWYLLVTTLLSVGQLALERRFRRGTAVAALGRRGLAATLLSPFRRVGGRSASEGNRR